MSKFYTYSTWFKTFNPVKSHCDINGIEDRFIWTEIQGEGGEYIIAGAHFVNRIGYHITEIPWTDEYTEVPIYGYEECDCVIDEEPNRECKKCEGSGEAMVDVDNLDYLRKIYNNDPRIVG